jgi:Tol biopolymer transport system component
MKATLFTLAAAFVAALVMLVSGPAEAAFPGANGRILFNSNMNGNSEIYSINPDGSGIAQLTNDPADDWSPAVSPDGTRIAFSSARSGSSDIYLMDVDGSNPTRLTFTRTWEGMPAWSPDGSKIAYVVTHDGDYDVFVMNANGSNQTQLTIYNGDDYNVDPAWSPDGTELALATRWGIQVLEVNQAGPIVADPPGYFLTHSIGEKEDNSPSWSPDGSLVVFSRTPNGAYRDLYGVEASYSGNPLAPNPAVNMTQTPWARESDPAWSPDGKRLAYSMAYATGRGHIDLELYIMDWGAYGIPTAKKLSSFPGGEADAEWSSLPTGRG